MLSWSLKQVKYFILIFLKNGSSVEVDKIIKCTIYDTGFFSSSGGVDDVLERLSLITQIFKDVNLMCI